jgi:hypothetical protein
MSFALDFLPIFGITTAAYFITPFVLVGGTALASSIYGSIKHHYLMNTDSQYYFEKTAKRINTLKIWQDHIQDLDQYERAILQISEAQDIPYELWPTLIHDDNIDSNAYFRIMQKMFNEPHVYEKFKDFLIETAIDFYTTQYAKFKGISKEKAQEHMINLVSHHTEKRPRILDNFIGDT